MKNSNGEKKTSPAAILTAIAALIASLGTFANDCNSRKRADDLQSSLFQGILQANKEVGEIRERLAGIETDIKWMRTGRGASRPECFGDRDCPGSIACSDGRCVTAEVVEEVVPDPPAPATVEKKVLVKRAQPKSRPKSYEELKSYVQRADQAWEKWEE